MWLATDKRCYFQDIEMVHPEQRKNPLFSQSLKLEPLAGTGSQSLPEK